MSSAHLSIPQAAAQAWRDGIRAMGAHLSLTNMAFLICAAIMMFQEIVLPEGPENDLKSLVVGAVVSVAQAFLLTPYFIAIHRFIILHERTQSYLLAPTAPRFIRFFGWSVLLAALTWVPSLIAILLTSSAGMHSAIAVVVAVITTIVSIRLITLFPSIAVDAPGATWRNAIANTDGYALRIFLICTLSLLPLIVIVVLALTIADSFAVRMHIGEFTLWSVANTFLQAALALLAITLAIAIASRLYERLGDHAEAATT